jgi:hypothetical protein
VRKRSLQFRGRRPARRVLRAHTWESTYRATAWCRNAHIGGGWHYHAGSSDPDGGAGEREPQRVAEPLVVDEEHAPRRPSHHDDSVSSAPNRRPIEFAGACAGRAPSGGPRIGSLIYDVGTMSAPLLRATRDPDIRTIREWHSKLRWVGGALIVCAIVFAIFVHLRGAAALLALAMFPLVLATQRTVVNRRSATFDVRFPWTGDAAPAHEPISGDRIRVRRDVTKSKGTVDITFAVVVGDTDLASGMGGEDAERLAGELRDFLGGRDA